MATPDKIRIEQDTLSQPTLFLAFELGQNTWKLGFTIGMAQQPRERTIPAGALDILQHRFRQY
jgi:hypothetical protein